MIPLMCVFCDNDNNQLNHHTCQEKKIEPTQWKIHLVYPSKKWIPSHHNCRIRTRLNYSMRSRRLLLRMTGIKTILPLTSYHCIEWLHWYGFLSKALQLQSILFCSHSTIHASALFLLFKTNGSSAVSSLSTSVLIVRVSSCSASTNTFTKGSCDP